MSINEFKKNIERTFLEAGITDNNQIENILNQCVKEIALKVKGNSY